MHIPLQVVKELPSSDTSPSDPKPAPRRHTMAAPTRPNRPKPPTSEAKTTDFDRPKFQPPDIMTESLYATVKKLPKTAAATKSSEFPAPSLPAPPPPYSGKSMVHKSAALPPDSKERSSTPEYMPVGGVTEVVKPSAAPPPSRPSRPPAGW